MNAMTGWRAQGVAHDKDFYETPRCAVEFLLRHESFVGPIWEPACGRGAISEVLIEHGHNVISQDLVDRGYGDSACDFLRTSHPALHFRWNTTTNQMIEAPARCIITNPPFNLALEFALHAIVLGVPKICLLLRSLWTEGSARRDKLFLPHPPARIYQISERLPFMHRADYAGPRLQKGTVPFSWFVWDAAHTGETLIRWRR